jgi:CDP-paratose 2-epimerase
MAIRGNRFGTKFMQANVAQLLLHFFHTPRCGEVYNLGGGRQNSLSILETIVILADMGFQMNYTYVKQHRIGDHICYISDLPKLRAHFPNWKLEYDLSRIIYELVERYTRKACAT